MGRPPARPPGRWCFTARSSFDGLSAHGLSPQRGLALLGTIGSGLAVAMRDDGHRDAASITFVVTASGLALWGVLRRDGRCAGARGAALAVSSIRLQKLPGPRGVTGLPGLVGRVEAAHHRPRQWRDLCRCTGHRRCGPQPQAPAKEPCHQHTQLRHAPTFGSAGDRASAAPAACGYRRWPVDNSRLAGGVGGRVESRQRPGQSGSTSHVI